MIQYIFGRGGSSVILGTRWYILNFINGAVQKFNAFLTHAVALYLSAIAKTPAIYISNKTF